MNKQIKWICFCLITCTSILLIAFAGSRAATVMSENLPLERIATIVIDAGHGGEDGGASSPAGVPESTYNLNIALRLESLLQLLGLDTRMIRREDVSVYTEGKSLSQKKRSDLKERVRMVNETDNALLLSIHQNNFSDGRYSGAQVFYADTSGSAELAKMMQDTFISSLETLSKRTIKRAEGIYLMEHIQSPGILIECGFLSNPQEELLLRNSDYQKKLVCIIAVTTKNYVDSIGNTNT